MIEFKAKYSFFASVQFIFILLFHSVQCQETKSKSFRICPVKLCSNNATTELEAWDCFGAHIFRPTDDPRQELFVEHDCGGVGWGNSIRGLYNAFSLAAVLNRRLVIRFDAMHRLWLPPNNLTQWDFGVDEVIRSKGSNLWESREIWDFEAYGRSPNRYRYVKRTEGGGEHILSHDCDSNEYGF